jgi:FMN phosphatase YigB (HAD superfamily)
VKKLSLFILLIIFSCSRVLKSEEPVKVVAFDCHGVIFEKKPWNVHNEIIHFIWNHYEVLPKSCIILPKLLYYWYQGVELTITNIINYIPELQPYKEVLYEFVRLKKPITKTLELIKKLKQNNVVIVLASNIHEDAFAYNKMVMPEIFELFDICYTRAESNGTLKQEMDYFLQMYSVIYSKIGHSNFQILFIDDDYENSVVAKNSHESFDAVHFTSPEKLEVTLLEKSYLHA